MRRRICGDLFEPLHRLSLVQVSGQLLSLWSLQVQAENPD
jgi:hypothetical protein